MALADRFHGLVMLGAPGAGKGTQAKLISEILEIPHISSGELFRENARANTELGRTARQYTDKGLLVPDDLTISMVRERLMNPDCKRGFVLDGFPRTVPQADALNTILADVQHCITLVPYLKVNERMLMERLLHRLTCNTCGATYSTGSLSPGDTCEKQDCGGTLYKRVDDEFETQKKRIDEYEAKTAPLVSYYASRGVLARLSGEHTVDFLFRKLLEAMRDSRDCKAS
jgi:adenylate kinase